MWAASIHRDNSILYALVCEKELSHMGKTTTEILIWCVRKTAKIGSTSTTPNHLANEFCTRFLSVLLVQCYKWPTYTLWKYHCFQANHFRQQIHWGIQGIIGMTINEKQITFEALILDKYSTTDLILFAIKSVRK